MNGRHNGQCQDKSFFLLQSRENVLKGSSLDRKLSRRNKKKFDFYGEYFFIFYARLAYRQKSNSL